MAKPGETTDSAAPAPEAPEQAAPPPVPDPPPDPMSEDWFEKAFMGDALNPALPADQVAETTPDGGPASTEALKPDSAQPSTEPPSTRRGAAATRDAETIATQQAEIDRLANEKVEADRKATELQQQRDELAAQQQKAVNEAAAELGDWNEIERRLGVLANPQTAADLSDDEHEELNTWLDARRKYNARQQVVLANVQNLMHSVLADAGLPTEALAAIQQAGQGDDPAVLFRTFHERSYAAGAAAKAAELEPKLNAAETKATDFSQGYKAARTQLAGYAQEPVLGGDSGGVIPGTEGQYDPRKTAEENMAATFGTPATSGGRKS
jgi:FtsZ-binding cell division protein ZapB